jgi:hypothetical protein
MLWVLILHHKRHMAPREPTPLTDTDVQLKMVKGKPGLHYNYVMKVGNGALALWSVPFVGGSRVATRLNNNGMYFTKWGTNNHWVTKPLCGEWNPFVWWVEGSSLDLTNTGGTIPSPKGPLPQKYTFWTISAGVNAPLRDPLGNNIGMSPPLVGGHAPFVLGPQT